MLAPDPTMCTHPKWPSFQAIQAKKDYNGQHDNHDRQKSSFGSHGAFPESLVDYPVEVNVPALTVAYRALKRGSDRARSSRNALGSRFFAARPRHHVHCPCRWPRSLAHR